MAGGADVYYGIFAACMVLYVHIFIVSKLMQKKVGS